MCFSTYGNAGIGIDPEREKIMKHFKGFALAAGLALLLGTVAPRAARADDFNDRTIAKFTGAVQVPGMTLPAGTYVFKVLQSEAERVVVQISNERESHVFATLIATPNHHMTREARREDPIAPTTDKTVFTFYEAKTGQPQPLRAWFYPGQSYGFEFVYSKEERDKLLK
jgi:hypothetical protein